MTYTGGDIASLRFLAANAIYQLTQAILHGDDESDRGALHDTVQLLNIISSYETESDPKFAMEVAKIQEARRNAESKLRSGEELAPATLEDFRWRELKAMFRSLCRQGVFVRQESPEAEWKPTKK